MSTPTQSRVVIIGGGIIGCSVAYHLTKLGWRDVLLLEQGRLSSGTTWHAAGLVGQLRSQSSMTRLIRYSTELYASLENETGLATGWKRCGSVSVARTEERIIALADEQSHLMESVRGAQTIKLFGAETAREAAWRPHHLCDRPSRPRPSLCHRPHQDSQRAGLAAPDHL